MPIPIPPQSTKTRELAPAGTHLVVCYSVVELGTQKSPYDDKEKQKVRVTWELDELMANGWPFVVGKTYNLSSHPSSALMLDLVSWIGDEARGGFDLEQLIGRVAVINIRHDEGSRGVYAAVASLMGPPREVPQFRTPRSKPVTFSFAAYDDAVFANLAPWMKEAIVPTPEFAAATGRMVPPLPGERPVAQLPAAPLGRSELDDDIPF